MSWKTVALGEVCKVIAGQSPEGKYYNNDGNGLPFYQGKKDFGSVYIKPPSVWTTDVTKEATKDDILMSVRAPVGPVNISTEDICIGRGLAAIRATDKIDKSYLFNFLMSIEKDLVGSSGAVFNSINKGQIESLQVPLPSLQLQQKIVAKLDAIFFEVDKATAAAKANAKNTEALFQSYLKQVFENDGNGWNVTFLSQISENLDSKRIPITKGIREEGEIPYYGASGIVDYVKDFIFDGDILLVSEDGANLLARTYPIAFSVSGKCWVNNHAHVVKFPNLISQKFVEFYLNSISLKPFVSGMAQPKLNQAMLNKIPIPFPSLEEQAKFVILFESINESSDMSYKAYIRKIEELSKFKNSILKQAFNGELVKE